MGILQSNASGTWIHPGIYKSDHAQLLLIVMARYRRYRCTHNNCSNCLHSSSSVVRRLSWENGLSDIVLIKLLLKISVYCISVTLFLILKIEKNAIYLHSEMMIECERTIPLNHWRGAFLNLHPFVFLRRDFLILAWRKSEFCYI